MPFLSSYKDGRILLCLSVLPKSSRSGLEGIHNNRVKLAITAPPVDGKANAAVITFLASFLGIKKKDIEIKHGMHSRQKGVLLEGVSEEDVRQRILAAISS